jgi:class 3 adenylate cyclase
MSPTGIDLKGARPGALLRRLIARSRRASDLVERDLTIMFTDITGFTELAEQLAPSQLAKLLTRHFSSLCTCIERERGVVGKVLGDGLLALWEHGENTAPALRAALAIRGAVEASNRVRGSMPPIRLRIGLHTGPLVMARLGQSSERGLTPLGDTVNVAQRLENAARHVEGAGEVAIVASDAVVARAGTGFRFEPLGALPVRGRIGSVHAYRLA